MNDKFLRSASRAALTLAVTGTLLGPIGCKKAAVDDATLNAAVQAKIQSDSAISTEPIQVSTTAGVVTLTGQVDNAAARTLAANDAAGVTGVQQVVDDITVGQTAPVTSAGNSAPVESSSRSRTRLEPRAYNGPEPRVTNGPLPLQQPAPIERVQNVPPPPPPQPPQPSFHNVTVPAGSVLPVRITQTLDSETTRPGDTFTGAIATDIIQDGVVVLPRGSGVSGTVVDAKDAGHFKGSSLLSIALTGVNRHGQQIAISTEPFSREGAGRGKNTAVKTGVGAAAGAVLGGIFGGGKGAAIGAAAGGGTGAGINAVTRGQQVQIPSETVVRFTTTNSFTVHVSSADANASRY